MGNQPSSERSHRIPQKLSKPRVGKHQAAASTSFRGDAGPNSRKSSGLSPRPAASSARHSNSHLISGPLSANPPKKSTSDVLPKEEEQQQQPIPRAPERRRSGLNQDAGRRRSITWIFQSNHSQSAIAGKRNSALFAATDATEDPRTSSPSVMHRDVHENYPPNSGFKRRSTHYGTAFFDSLQQPNGENSPSPGPLGDRSSQSYAYNGNEQQRDSMIGLADPPAQSAPTAHYIPSRRRSTIETPGVGTRPHPDSEHYLEKRRSFRNSLPVVPSPGIESPATFDTFEEFEAHMKAKLWSPGRSATIDSYSSVRIVTTPGEEDDYKQLGVMKFGSLRITNGGEEATTPGQETEDPCAKSFVAYSSGDVSPSEPKDSQIVNDFTGYSLRSPKKISPKTSNATIRADIPEETVVVPRPGADMETSIVSDSLGTTTQTDQTVKRSDSGVSSNFGSDKSNAHTPQLDSGYSSSVSLRSFFGSKKNKNQEAENKASDKGSPVPGQDLKQRPQQSPVKEDVGPTFSEVSNLGGLDAAKPTSRSRSNSTRSGVSIASKKSTDSSGSGSKRSRLSRLFKSRRQSLPESHSLGVFADSATPMPVDALDKLREHKSMAPNESDEKPTSKKTGERDGGASKPSHLATRAASILGPKSSNLSAASKSRHIGRKAKVDDDDGDDVMDSEPIWGYEAHVASVDSIRKSAGNSAFDQAFVSLSEEYAPPVPAKDGKPQGRHRLRTRKSAPEFLETVRETASPDPSSPKLPKTPPPVSLHTRGSKKKRRSKHHVGSSTLPLEPSRLPPPPPPKGDAPDEADPNRRYLSHTLRSFPLVNPQRRADGKPAQGAGRPGPGPQYDPRPSDHGRPVSSNPAHQAMPLYDPVQLFRRQTTSGFPQRHGVEPLPEATPYRVLHSYKLPSHKGVSVGNN